MRNYVGNVLKENVEGLDVIERGIINFEIGRLDKEIDWYSIKQIDMKQVEDQLRDLFPKGWRSLLSSVKLSAKVFLKHSEKTSREFYESLNAEEIETMNESLKLGIKGAMKIAG